MPLIHLLTGGSDLRHTRVACGDKMVVYALRQREAVTCPQCRDTLRRRTPPRDGMSEKQLQELLRQACGMHGWLYYHTHNSRHSPSGFIDTVAVRDTRLVCAELKRRGQEPTVAQQRWLEALAQVRTVEVYVWTEDDIPTLLEVLR
jgi:hypothetical protein